MALTQITEKGIKDGEIVNADINASAAIAKSKLAALDIVNADINSSAAIAGSKITPVFTSNIEVQNNAPGITFTDSNDSHQFYIQTDGDALNLVDATGSTTKIGISNTGHITLTGNVTVNNGYLEVSNSNLYIEENITHAGDGDTRIRFPAADAIALETGGNSSLYINSSGQVGIGTTSPNRLLHGYGTTPILKLEASNNEAYIQLTTLNQSNESYIGLVSGDIYMSTTGTGSSGNGERLRIKANGRVSINQGGPTGTLQVNDVNGDNVTLVLHTGATTNYIQLSDSVNAHTYIAKENSSNLSQVAFYASTSTGNGTGKVAHFDHRGLVLPANKGISFSPHDNTDTNPYGSDSNHLDDYERGSFQPAITSTSNPQPTQTAYVHQYGYYVKIGRMVHVRVDVEFSTSGVSGGTGYAILSNLPFTNSSEQNAYGITMGVGYSPNWYNNGCPSGGYMEPNQNWSYFMPYNTNGSTFSMGADIGGGTRLIAGLTYMVNS